MTEMCLEPTMACRLARCSVLNSEQVMERHWVQRSVPVKGLHLELHLAQTSVGLMELGLVEHWARLTESHSGRCSELHLA